MPSITPRKLTDQEMKLLVEAELDSAMGYMDSELSQERADAMDRYLGEPLGNEMEGRSQVQTRDVMETIEWIMPSLIRIFTDKDKAVEFSPVGPEDEQQAEQETQYLNYLFYKKMNGFLILYSWFKDALLQKNGVVKSYAEENEEVTTESYFDLQDFEFQALMSEEDIEVIEHEERTEMVQFNGQVMPMTVHDIKIEKVSTETEFCTEVIPPEEFLISTDARSIDPTKARFCAHRTTKTVSELREMGFDDSEIGLMEMGESEVEFSEERIARMNLAGEEAWDDVSSVNMSMRKVKVAECYIRVDQDGDGRAELLKVFYSGDFIDWEDIDYHPFDTLTPIILTHKFFGLSVADILTDIQEIRTSLLRNYLDNIYQTVNGTTYYDENTVNIDDMLTSKPYGIRGVDGPPGQSILHIPPSALPAEAYSLDEMMDKLIANRIGETRAQLDPNLLAQANTGVVIKMLNEAKAKVEMIARIFAEIGVKELFRTLHHLVRKHSDAETRMQLSNQWVPVDPREWKERKNLTVNVGLGTQDDAEQLANLNQLFVMQTQAMQMGLPVVMPQNIFAIMTDMAKLMGVRGEKYFTHPSQIPPPQPQKDPNELIVQAQMQIEGQKRQVEVQKMQLENEKKQAELQLKLQELALKNQSEAGKHDLELLKAEMDRVKVLTNEQKELLALQLKRKELENKEDSEAAKAAMQLISQSTQNTLDKYIADLNAQVELIKAGLSSEQNTNRRAEQLIVGLMDSIEEMRKEQSEPEDVEYDDSGRLVRVGKKRIERDGSGKIAKIKRN